MTRDIPECEPQSLKEDNLGYRSVPMRASQLATSVFVIRNLWKTGRVKFISNFVSPMSVILWLLAAHTFVLVVLMFVLVISRLPLLVIRLIDAPESNKTFVGLLLIISLKIGNLFLNGLRRIWLFAMDRVWG